MGNGADEGKGATFLVGSVVLLIANLTMLFFSGPIITGLIVQGSASDIAFGIVALVVLFVNAAIAYFVGRSAVTQSAAGYAVAGGCMALISIIAAFEDLLVSAASNTTAISPIISAFGSLSAPVPSKLWIYYGIGSTMIAALSLGLMSSAYKGAELKDRVLRAAAFVVLGVVMFAAAKSVLTAYLTLAPPM